MNPRVADVETYISDFPPPTQKLLKQLRALIKKVAPAAEEVISYNMPAYQYKGRLVYFAGYSKHIGLYPMASTITKFKKEIARYKNAKGSVQFPLNEPLPVDLITKMIRFRMKENERKLSLIKLKKLKK